jgi:hypothetical protein
MSSSATARPTACCSDPGHEARKLEDLLHPLDARQLQVVALQPRPLYLPVGGPIADPLRSFHLRKGSATSGVLGWFWGVAVLGA